MKNVISFMNMKGGVGKTTLCVNLADCLVRHFNKTVLIIDMDPQFNATQYILSPEFYAQEIFPENKTIRTIFETKELKSDVFNGTPNLKKEPIIAHIEHTKSGLDLVCGDLRMCNIPSNNPKIENRLKRFIQNNNLNEKYDFIFIDCPPTNSIYTVAAFITSKYYLLPVKPDFLSSLGINLFQSYLADLDDDENLECLGMIFTMVQNYPYYSDKMHELRITHKIDVFDNIIKQSSEISSNSEKQKTMYQSAFKSDIINLTQEFLDRYSSKEGDHYEQHS